MAGAGTEAVTVIFRTPSILPFASSSWGKLDVRRAHCARTGRYPLGKLALKNWVAVAAAAVWAADTVFARFTDRPAAARKRGGIRLPRKGDL